MLCLYQMPGIPGRRPIQQVFQLTQCLPADDRRLLDPHSAAGGPVQHPLWDFQPTGTAIVLAKLAAGQLLALLGPFVPDQDFATIPRMPGVVDLRRLGIVCVGF